MRPQPTVRGWPSVSAALAVVVGLLIAVAPAGARQAPTTFAAAGCRRQGPVISQAMNGRFSGCLRLGPLAAGPHTIVLEQVTNFSPGPPAAKLRLRHVNEPPAHEPPVTVTLSPSSGGPGTVVTVTIHVPASVRARASQLHPGLCWDGCRLGLEYGGSALRRVGARTFRERLTVPAAPWAEGGPARIAPLRTGDYAIGVQCLLLLRGCGALRAEGSASFHLRAGSPSWCPDQFGCASLRVHPGRALPGDLVRVTGEAPLVSIDGSDQPFADQFEVLRGRPSGARVAFHRGNGLVTVTFGRGALAVARPPSFTGLRQSVPLAEVSDGLPLISANPLDPSTVGSCAPGAVELSSAGSSAPPTTIPTVAAGPTLTALGYQVSSNGPIACQGLELLDTPAGALAGVVAAFPAAPAIGGPPFYDVPLVTRDGGATWSAPPTPPDTSLLGFGGLRYAGGATELVFGINGRGGTATEPVIDSNRPVGLLTDDGGASWTSGPLGCPAAGPCVTLSPYYPGNCAMNGTTQTVLRSVDGGTRFSSLPPFDQVQACGEAELAATSTRDELLIDTQSPYPVQQSTDGGVTWSDVGVPTVPGEHPMIGLGPGPGGLTLLPDGALLLTGGAGYSGGWQLLAHGARTWCRVTTPSVAIQRLQQLSPLTVIGGELWWLTGPFDSTAAPAIDRLAVASVAC